MHKLKGNELMLIPILMFVFSIGGTTYGMSEETVPFYLLLAATMVAAGFDSLTGAAVVLLGAGCGVLGSTVNPFAVGVAVDALAGVGIEVNQAIIIVLGIILWLVTLAIATVFVMRYAKKVKEDKGSCFLSLQEQEAMMEEWGLEASEREARSNDEANAPTMTGRQKWSLAVFAFTFVVMIVGFVPWGSFGIDVFDAGAAYEEVVTPVTGEEDARRLRRGQRHRYHAGGRGCRRGRHHRGNLPRLVIGSSRAFLWAAGTSTKRPPGFCS